MGKKDKKIVRYGGSDIDYKAKYVKYKIKFENLRSQTGGNGNGNDADGNAPELNRWIHQDGKQLDDGRVVEGGPVAYYRQIVKKYGKPTYCVNQPHGVCKWIKGQTEKGLGPHEYIMLIDEYVQHDKPRPHHDFMYSVIKMYIPPEKMVGILRISSSINYDPLYKHLRARCASFAANFATFKTVYDKLYGEESEYGANIDVKEQEEKSNEQLTIEMIKRNQEEHGEELEHPYYPIEKI